MRGIIFSKTRPIEVDNPLETCDAYTGNGNPPNQARASHITVLSRVSTALQAVGKDNQYSKDEAARKVYPTTDPEINREDELIEEELERTGSKLSATYDGEFNKIDLINQPPDGGFWAWTCAICVMFINAFSWGADSSFGVFLDYYINSNVFPGATIEEYALIGGLNLGLSFMLCALTNVLIRRYNYKLIMIIGTIMLIVCWECAAEAKTITQLIMIQGFLLSIAYALAAGPAIVIIPTWFLKKRAIASGIGYAGAGIAGIVFSRSIDEINCLTGSYKWSLRAIGFMSGFMMVICVLLIRTNRKIEINTSVPLWTEFYRLYSRWDILRKPAMLSLMAWYFVYSIGYGILLMSLSNYGTSIGLTTGQSSMVNTVQCVSQAVGRPTLGAVSSYFGNVNTTILFCLILGAISMAWWIFIESYGELLAFTFIAGFIQGINWVTYAPMASDIVGGGDDLLSALAYIYLTGGPPGIVSEIIGLSLTKDNDRPYFWCQILVGLSILVSIPCLLPFREFKIRRMLEARQHLIDRKVVDTLTGEDQQMRERYISLLRKDMRGVLLRTFYPIKA